jgi:Tfp pilus assembly protein PilX
MGRYLRNQRGVAMLVELVLLAVVLGLVGLALYLANHRVENRAVSQGKVTTTSVAEASVKAMEQEAEAEAVLSTEAEAAADEFTAADDDAANLGDSFDESRF